MTAMMRMTRSTRRMTPAVSVRIDVPSTAPPVGRGQSAEVDELQRDVEVFALEQSDRRLQVVTVLRTHAKLVALNLRFDALGCLVTNDLADLLGILLADALFEGGLDA